MPLYWPLSRRMIAARRSGLDRHEKHRDAIFWGAGATLAGNPRAAAVQADGSLPDRRKKQPNLIFFMPDELRADALSCYGNPVCRTPNLDRLASEGTRFSQCHAEDARHRHLRVHRVAHPAQAPAAA